MADRVRIGSFNAHNHFVAARDVNDQETYAFIRDTLAFTPPPPRQVVADQERRWGGGIVVGETHENGAVAAEWYVSGADRDDAVVNAEALLADLTGDETNRYLEWRPDGASRSVYFELRGPGQPEVMHRWLEWQQTGKLHLKASVPVAPLAVGDYMDTYEHFEVPEDSMVMDTNWLPDPSFEAEGLPSWTVYQNGGTGVLERATFGPRSGGFVARLTKSTLGGANELGANTVAGIPVEPGEIWSIGAYFLAFTIARDVGVVATFHDATGAQIAAATGSQIQDTTAAWTRATHQGFVVPAGAVTMKVQAIVYGVAGVGEIHFIDDAMAVRSDSIPAFFYGGSPRSAWTGTPNASASELYEHDALDDYTFDAGDALTLQATQAELVPIGGAGVERRAVHTAKGYSVRDAQALVGFMRGDTAIPFKVGAVLSRVSADTYIECYGSITAGPTHQLKIDTVVDGVRTNRFVTTIPASINGDFAYSVMGRREGNRVHVDFFDSGEPHPISSVDNPNGSYTLNPAEQITFAEGGDSGWVFTPDDGVARLHKWTHEPYTYRRALLPRKFQLPSVPGTAPALVDVSVSLWEVARPWALVAWDRPEAPRNLVWNGDFTVSMDGWFNNQAFTNLSTLARNGAPDAFGTWGYLSLTTQAFAESGAEFPIHGHTFERGKTYTAELWIRRNSGDANGGTELVLGAHVGVNSVAVPITTTSDWERKTVTWTSTADVEWFSGVSVAVRDTTSTGGRTYYIDGVMVYEGTEPPTSFAQTEGRGAFPPFGVLEAAGRESAQSFVQTASAPALGGDKMRWSGISGAQSAQLTWLLDPSLYPSDDFSLNELRIEAWARVQWGVGPVAPKFTLSAESSQGTAGAQEFGPRRYTQEWGSNGRIITNLPTATAWRYHRLGTLNLVSDPHNPQRWRLVLDVATATGSTGELSIDALILVPIRRRAASPSNRINDASYPKFTNTTSEITRVLKSDGTGWGLGHTAGHHHPPLYPSIALGPPLPELPPGDSELFVAVSGLVPDEPVSGASSDSLAADVLTTVHAGVRPRYFHARGD